GAASHEITAPPTATTYSATFVPQSTLTFTPVADAYVRATRATTNYGTANRLTVNNPNYRSYLRFTVGGVTGTVTSVKLRLRVTDASTNSGSVNTVGAGWTETGITWNNAPVISGTPVATIGATTVNTWKELDLTGVVTGNGSYDLAISGGNSNTTDFASREATSANRPQLVVTFAP
ncbi:MAG TPA: DNRLRE domain-containing protein, partial [Candidatus Limnocylindrales bacterium]